MGEVCVQTQARATLSNEPTFPLRAEGCTTWPLVPIRLKPSPSPSRKHGLNSSSSAVDEPFCFFVPASVPEVAPAAVDVDVDTAGFPPWMVACAAEAAACAIVEIVDSMPFGLTLVRSSPFFPPPPPPPGDGGVVTAGAADEDDDDAEAAAAPTGEAAPCDGGLGSGGHITQMSSPTQTAMRLKSSLIGFGNEPMSLELIFTETERPPSVAASDTSFPRYRSVTVAGSGPAHTALGCTPTNAPDAPDSRHSSDDGLSTVREETRTETSCVASAPKVATRA